MPDSPQNGPEENPKVLVVEDRYMLRNGLVRLLNRKGYEVIAPENQNDLFELLNQKREDIALVIWDAELTREGWTVGYSSTLIPRARVAFPNAEEILHSGRTRKSLSSIDIYKDMDFIPKPPTSLSEFLESIRWKVLQATQKISETE